MKTNSRCYISISANFLRFCVCIAAREGEERERARERQAERGSEMAREIDTWSNRTTEVGTSCEKDSPHHLFTSVAFPKPATTAARSMICSREALVFVFCSHQLTKGLPMYLPTYRWTTVLPLMYQQITPWPQPTYWPFTCMYFHAKSISTSAQYVTLHWKSCMRYRSQIQRLHWKSVVTLKQCTAFRALEAMYQRNLQLVIC